MMTHTADSISLHDLEQLTLMNRNKIDAWFQQQFGMRSMPYLRKIRMELAMQLVTNSEMDFEDIAEKVGYTTVSNFFTAYKRYWQQTAGNMRRKSLS